MRRFKAYPFLFHLPGWLLFLAFPLLFMNGGAEGASAGKPFLSPYYWQFCLFYVALFYVNAYWLFPKFFLQGKYVAYAGAVLGLLMGLYWLQPFDQMLRHQSDRPVRGQGPYPSRGSIQPTRPPTFGSASRPGPPAGPGANRQPLDRGPGAGEQPPPADRRGPAGRAFDITSFFIGFIILSLSSALATAQQWRASEERAVRAEAQKAQAEADRTQAELSLLKAQINPHFLFNTLNNLYSLALTGHEKTAESIMKLSQIMRYVTNQTGHSVSLAQEAGYLRDYVDLQRLRLTQPELVAFTVEGSLRNKTIAPLVLMTFVENAFKYGISALQPAPLTIRLSAADSISFFCQNRVFAPILDTERNGIGLANTRQRLNHLYPGTYQLTISRENDLFTVQLTLPITVGLEEASPTPDTGIGQDSED